jgi:general secretion pathway protein D
VPGLGSIPVLGWLFKSKRRERTKVNLLMILVPHILETPDDVRRIHERRMKERLEFLERYTAFKRRDLELNVNYRKKAGLLATINREAGRMVSEEEFRRQAEAEMQQQTITGELGFSPKFEEEAEEDASEPTPAQPRQPGTGEPSSTGQRKPRRPRNTGNNPP